MDETRRRIDQRRLAALEESVPEELKERLHNRADELEASLHG